MTVYRRHPDSRLHFGEYARALRLAGKLDELRALAQSVNLHIYDEMRPDFLHDLSRLERFIYAEVCLEVCQTPEALAQLCRSVQYLVKYDIPGDIVECGVYKGASIVAIIRTLQEAGVERNIWLYDTYEGMPKPEAIDRFYSASTTNDGGLLTWEQTKRNDGSGGSNWVYSPLDEVREYVLETGYPESLLHFVKGKVEDTIPRIAPKNIGLLRLDTDFYASTKHELETLYPRMVMGGC